MFGEWSKRFGLAPITREATNAARRSFRDSLQAELQNSFLFSGEVSLTMTLYLIEHKMLEDAKYGDLDNHMKPLLDALKGPDGLLVDDSQVQHMVASWIDVPGEEFFELEIKASPDDFIMKPVKLYEMPNGLFYPISTFTWSPEGPKEIRSDLTALQLRTLANLTGDRKFRRHELVQNGASKLEAFERTRRMAPVQMGFHKSKVVESGFERVAFREWSDA